MSNESLVSANVDYDRDGKQFGNLCVPQSTNSAGWSVAFIPVVVVKNGEGPTVVLFGGNHGDECEGPVTLLKLARTLDPSQVKGRVIIVPMLNRPAVAGGTRLSPIDGANMNRAFPGKRGDSITGMIAHYVSSKILPLADLVVDIHSGGSSMHFLPSVNMHDIADRKQMDRMLEAAQAWRAPYIFIYEDVAGEGLLPSLAEGMGKVTLGTEMGSKAQFGVETLRITERGVYNTLHWQGILIDPPADNTAVEPEIVAGNDTKDYIMAPGSGLFEPFFELEDRVEVGQPVGQVHDIEHPEQDAIIVRAETEGMVMGRRSVPLTSQGECVMVLVRPYSVR